MKVELVKVARRLEWPLWAMLSVCAWLGLGGTAVWLSSRLGQPLQLCLFKRVTGLPCPTCGFTRGALCLLKGQPGHAWLYNPLLFSVLGLFFGACLARVVFARSLKIRLSRTERRSAWIVGIALFVCNWVYVILHVK